MTVHACTIIARNYLPFARVLARSFAAHHPDGRFGVLVIDDVDGTVVGGPGGEPFDVFHIDDLGQDVDELYRMASMYDVTELATALKPWFLEALLRMGAPSVLYIDPDILIARPLDRLARLAEERGIVLTPHLTRPMTRDGRMATELSILASGAYNLGFIGVGHAALAELAPPITEAIRKRTAYATIRPDEVEHVAAPFGGASAAAAHLHMGETAIDPFLEYWKQRLVRECVTDPQGMLFVDQRWIDFVPGIYDVAIVRDPTCNVAYWNLDRRDLRWDGSSYVVDGDPLTFFHFSGFSPDRPQVLSKHQGCSPRVLLSERPDVRRICDEYRGLLLDAGYVRGSGPSYGFDVMANGTRIDDVVRRVVRESVRQADFGRDEYPPVPWTVAEADGLCAWLRAAPRVLGDPGNLSVYLATVFGKDVHALRVAFFDPQGADRAAFLAWARAEAAAGRLVPELVPDDDSRPAQPVPGGGADVPELDGADDGSMHQPGGTWAPRDQLRPGMTVAGYLQAELGMGEAARLAVRAVEAAGIPVATYSLSRLASRQRHPFNGETPGVYDYDVNLVCVNADQVGEFASLVGPGFFDGRYNIAQWSWELDEFPERWASATAPFSEIWAVSEFARRAIVVGSDVPVFAVPHPVVAPEVPDGIDRSVLGLPDDRFLFLFCFDLLSVIERKNPAGVVEAFRRAFGEPGAWKGRGQAPLLVIKVINAERDIVALERLRLAAEDNDVLLIEGYMDRGHVAALMQVADCYVSLHRSEGFGLTMAESMALGKPVIATAYSGNLDFMDDTTAYLVPWAPVPVGPGNDPYPAEATWAEPDLDAAARMMRWVVEHPDEAQATGERARASVLTRHGPDARAVFIRERMAAIQALRRGGVEPEGRDRGAGPAGSDGDRAGRLPSGGRRFARRKDRSRQT